MPTEHSQFHSQISGAIRRHSRDRIQNTVYVSAGQDCGQTGSQSVYTF